MQRINATIGQGHNDFSINNCPKTIPDVDNDCDKKLDHYASLESGTCKYSNCAELEYIRRDAYMSADGFYSVEGCGMRPLCVQTKHNNCNDRKASWQECVNRGAAIKQDDKQVKTEAKFGTGSGSTSDPGGVNIKITIDGPARF